METFSSLLALCAGNSPVTGEFPTQRPVTRSFDVSFDLRLNQHLSKQWRRRWFETPSRPLICHCNGRFAVVRIHYIVANVKYKSFVKLNVLESIPDYVYNGFIWLLCCKIHFILAFDIRKFLSCRQFSISKRSIDHLVWLCTYFYIREELVLHKCASAYFGLTLLKSSVNAHISTDKISMH